MRPNHRLITLLLASLLASAGCFGGGQVYDTYRQDYHHWDRGEDRLYRQWEFSNHRHHMGLTHRSARDQRAYWNWRHR
jgi:hypothetical protein